MYDGFLKIPISRLLANRRFARDVFLAMPRNQKLLRLVSANGELTSEILERIKAGGSRDLYVRPEPGDAPDPQKFPLYFDDFPESTPAPGAAPESPGSAANPAAGAVQSEGSTLSRASVDP